MSRQMSPKRMEALRIWLKSDRKKKLKDIAEEVGVSAGQIRKWKSIDKWDDIPKTAPNKRGAPYRNKNALGNKGGAPEGNLNALKHGMFKKWLPNDDELEEIYDTVRANMSTLDILYEEILVMFTNYIRAQKIMYVKDQDDMTRVIKSEKITRDKMGAINEDGEKVEVYAETESEREYDIQYAWDKHANALKAQAAASNALSRKIKQYEELLRTLPPEEVNEEHRLRAQKLRADIEAVKTKAW
ncbi:phage terminase small subunit [Gracilibacillus saliphilus]|uniref:phage terminase small subunit n=1 Tax=Gracilibacillus saliphilus TaxID=543890 RepID=UPI0013CF46A8|nr:phage terminase small subunit [Gracilibacillus saliphilus]